QVQGLAVDGEQPGTVLGAGGGAQGEEAAAAAAEVAGRGEGALDAGGGELQQHRLGAQQGGVGVDPGGQLAGGRGDGVEVGAAELVLGQVHDQAQARHPALAPQLDLLEHEPVGVQHGGGGLPQVGVVLECAHGLIASCSYG